MSSNANKITSDEFVQFNEHLLGLVKTRLPLDAGLRRMAEEVHSRGLKGFAETISHELEQGSQLSEALEKYRPQLPDYYIALLRAGETGGSLAEVLHHVVTETRRQIDHRRAIVISLAYPVMVALFAVTIFALVCWKVIPEFVDIYHQLGADLPRPTQITVDVAFAIRDYFLLVAVALGGVFGIVAVFPPARPARDALLLNLPIVGRLVYNDIAISFTRSLGFLLKRKVAMTDALGLTESVMQNRIARQCIGRVREGVANGERLSDMLDAYVFLPPSTRWMIRLAEDRGDLDQVLLDTAEFYEIKQEQARRAVRGMLEPAIIAGLGIVIGTMVITLYLPLFSIPHMIL